MAGRGPQTFHKRQKEEKRKEKQMEKLLRRRQATAPPQASQVPSENPDGAEQTTEPEPHPDAPLA